MQVQLSAFKPDADSVTPLYLQLANKLSDGIHSGLWQPDQARLAGIEPGTAMLYITRIGSLENGSAIELTHAWCRCDYYDVIAELRR
jgi:DNA-binding GntR family transcriptional regulator